jgi:hypothetical protein
MGLRGLTLYLKGAFVLYQQSLGGQVLKDSASVNKIRVSRTNRGLPRIIPRNLRYGVRMHHAGIMRFVSSILNLFRDITFPGSPKMNTITDACKGTLMTVPALMMLITDFIPLFTKGRNALDFMNGGMPLFLIWKAAPGMIKDFMFGVSNYSTHPHNLLKSLLALYNQPKVWDAFIEILMIMNHKYILGLVDQATKLGLLIRDRVYRGPLGKLHAKEEPAGKVRIFAMVDAWTQWALYPLHKFIFACLAEIPQDGTFNQTAPLKTLLARKPKELYSLDLTAATDRLPLFLQKALLHFLIGQGFSEAWATLLVGRTYGFHQLGYSQWAGSYSYGTGQPMGAYSSWGMLALTHHFIVQASAWRAGVVPVGVWFEDYALLGDDLVIANSAVKDSYLEILKDLGMEVNLSKSLLSPSGACLEFAKRTIFIYPDRTWVDISPVAVKEMAAAQGLLPALIQFMVKHELTLAGLLQSFGFGWRNISQLNKPLGKLSAQIRSIVLASFMPKSAEEVESFFTMGAPAKPTFPMGLLEAEKSLDRLISNKMIPSVTAKVAAARNYLQSQWNLCSEMSSTATLWMLEKSNPYWGRAREELELTFGLAKFSGKSYLPCWFQLMAFTAEGQNEWNSLDAFTEKYQENVFQFYYALWKALYVPAAEGYLELCQEALNSFGRVAAMLFYIANEDGEILPATGPIDNRPQIPHKTRLGKIIMIPNPNRGEQIPVSRLRTGSRGLAPDRPGFYTWYFKFIQALEALSLASPAVLAFSKPQGREGFSGSIDAVTPVHMRYYRIWSGVIQGSLPFATTKWDISHVAKGNLPGTVKTEPGTVPSVRE